MFSLQLKDRIITVIISYKNNKNTYFRFKSNDTVTVSASKNQTTTQIKEYIIKHQQVFLRKLDAVQTYIHDYNRFQYFKESYLISRIENNKGYQLDTLNNILTIPLLTPDQEKIFLKNLSKILLLKELNYLTKKHTHNGIINIEKISLKTRYMKSRYGSCNQKKRNININLFLLHYDKKFLEYVFLHEITHLKVPNHSQSFYDTFQKLCPDYIKLRRTLKQIYIYR